MDLPKQENKEKTLSKYVGKYVAFVDENIVASGRTQLEAHTKAKKLCPGKVITLEYIPTKQETITFL